MNAFETMKNEMQYKIVAGFILVNTNQMDVNAQVLWS